MREQAIERVWSVALLLLIHFCLTGEHSMQRFEGDQSHANSCRSMHERHCKTSDKTQDKAPNSIVQLGKSVSQLFESTNRSLAKKAWSPVA